MDTGGLIEFALILLLGQWLLRYYLRKGESSIDLFRVLGYTFVGVGIGVLTVSVCALMYPFIYTDTTLVFRAGLFIVSVLFFGGLGYVIANKFPNSFRIESIPGSFGTYFGYAFLSAIFFGGAVAFVVSIFFPEMIFPAMLMGMLVGIIVGLVLAHNSFKNVGDIK